MQKIVSKDNPKLKMFLQLKTKKGRLKNKAYIIDGLRIVEHAILHHAIIKSIVVTQAFLSLHEDFVKTLEAFNVYIIDEKMMLSIVETQSPQGIFAVIEPEEKPFTKGKLLFLDEIQDPGNLGTLIRTADAAGFKGVILKEGCTDPYSQKAIRSSMGSIMSIPIWEKQNVETLNKLKVPVYGAALEGGLGYKDLSYPEEAILVIGNEAKGISKEVLECCHHKIYIPMAGHVESLNASIAGGILMFAMV